VLSTHIIPCRANPESFDQYLGEFRLFSSREIGGITVLWGLAVPAWTSCYDNRKQALDYFYKATLWIVIYVYI
jgi:hypothetical protein